MADISIQTALLITQRLQGGQNGERQTSFRALRTEGNETPGTYFNTEIPSVDVVPQEQVARGRWRPPYFKQLHEVEELPMDISTNCKGKTKTGGSTSEGSHYTG